MCGICGIVGVPDAAAVRRMARAMVHRGPDDENYYEDAHAVLGFRRLSIIDVAGGRQPLSNEDGSIRVVFNGEIYNHRDLREDLERRGHQLRTGSDGEVIAHLYEEHGEDLVDHLNGIFALAIWDARRQHLLLARDPHGVKPLYYAETPHWLMFASEIKALVASTRISREFDLEAVAHYLQFQGVPPPGAIVRGVRALEPGRVLKKTGGAATVRRYWTPPAERPDAITAPDEAAHAVREGLAGAVKSQLMAERPLGVFLSGGVDSSAIVALAAQHVPHRLKTFSVGFVGPDEQVRTEWPWARLVAERYNTDHHEFVLTEEMFRNALPATFRAMDQPTADGINSYWVSYAAAQHVTVALSGTGGDELFLGYKRDERLLETDDLPNGLRILPTGYVRAVMRLLEPIPDRLLWKPVARFRRSAAKMASLDGTFIAPGGIGIFDAAECAGLLGGRVARPNRTRGRIDCLHLDVPPDLSRPADWLARLEQRAYLSFILLRDIDAMSMAHSLEVRVPFLDRALGDVASRISWTLKLREGVGKWVLKQALRDLLPDSVLFRPKMGFGLPYPVWMRRSLAPTVREVLSAERVKRRGLVDPAVTTSLLERFYRGDNKVWRKVWMLFVLEGWATEVLDAA